MYSLSIKKGAFSKFLLEIRGAGSCDMAIVIANIENDCTLPNKTAIKALNLPQVPLRGIQGAGSYGDCNSMSNQEKRLDSDSDRETSFIYKTISRDRALNFLKVPFGGFRGEIRYLS